MKITKLDFVEGAQKAQGLTVIIDVFRAFSVACYCFNKGVNRIVPVASIETALNYQPDNSMVRRVGERHGKKLSGFDFGNSPTQILSENIEGCTIVQTTHSGTQGLVNATQASEVITGALVNADAIARYIRHRAPDQVSLVSMGWEANTKTDEDDICADYIESILLGNPMDKESIRQRLFDSPCADRFKDSAMPWSPFSDFEYCTEVDRFGFVLKLSQSKGELPYLKKIKI